MSNSALTISKSKACEATAFIAAAVRAGFARNEAQMLTPLEAAVGIRRGDMVEVLLENGARMDAATWTRLICFADVVEAGDVHAFWNSGVVRTHPPRARV